MAVDTSQVNVRLTLPHADLVRRTVARLRSDLTFEGALAAMLASASDQAGDASVALAPTGTPSADRDGSDVRAEIAALAARVTALEAAAPQKAMSAPPPKDSAAPAGRVSRAEFGRLHGVSRAMVTKWGNLGCIVDDGGLVDVAASDELLKARQFGRYRNPAA